MNVIAFTRPVLVETNPIAKVLDRLAVALADHGHVWSDDEVEAYEAAIAYCSSMRNATEADRRK